MANDLVNVRQAKTHLSGLLDLAHGGQEIILAKAGKPCARWMPLAQAPAVRRPGRLQGRLDDDDFVPLPDIELLAWNGAIGSGEGLEAPESLTKQSHPPDTLQPRARRPPR